MDKPLVSVIVPCYNQGIYLNEALQSIYNQTYSNWECIILNDGSEDHTENVAKSWVEKDERFRYVYKINGGLASARNSGLLDSTGDFIQFLDADDFLDKEKLHLSIEKTDSQKKNEIVVTDFEYFNEDISKTSSPNFQLTKDFFDYRNILMLWPTINIPIHCGLFSSTIFKELFFVEELKACEDWIMWIMILKTNPEITFIQRPLAFYRKHSSNMTRDTILMEKYNLKAVNYILENIALGKKIRSHFEELQNFKNKTRKLENTILNYRNTRSFKYSEKLKKSKVISFFIRFPKWFQK